MERTTELVLKLADALNNTEYGKRIINTVFSKAYQKGMFTAETVEDFKEKFLIKFFFFCCQEDKRLFDLVAEDVYNELRKEETRN